MVGPPKTQDLAAATEQISVDGSLDSCGGQSACTDDRGRRKRKEHPRSFAFETRLVVDGVEMHALPDELTWHPDVASAIARLAEVA